MIYRIFKCKVIFLHNIIQNVVNQIKLYMSIVVTVELYCYLTKLFKLNRTVIDCSDLFNSTVTEEKNIGFITITTVT